MKWFIEWEDDVGNWIDAQEFEGEIEAELKKSHYYFKGNWFPTSPTNALCLPYHGGWIACREIVKNKCHAGFVYSQDGTKLPPLKSLTKKQKAALDSILKTLKYN